jgi:hypothetical protein
MNEGLAGLAAAGPDPVPYLRAIVCNLTRKPEVNLLAGQPDRAPTHSSRTWIDEIIRICQNSSSRLDGRSVLRGVPVYESSAWDFRVAQNFPVNRKHARTFS